MNELVRVTVSSYRVNNELLGTVEPAGQREQASIDPVAVVGMLMHMMAMRANVGFRVEELGEHRIAVTYEYGMTHMLPGFPEPAGGWHEYAWLYVIESDSAQEINALGSIYEMLLALCNTYRDICSAATLIEVMKLVDDDSWEIANLRAALEYYASSSAWQGSTLVNGYSTEIISGDPWRIASNALQNRKVETLPEAIQRVIDRRDKAPEFIGRLSRA